MIILVDVDGVVADLHAGWLKRYNADYDDHLSVGDITEWSIHKFCKPECGQKMYDYLNDPTLYNDVPEVDGAKWGVDRLRELGHRVVYLSAGIYPAKVEWLHNQGFLKEYPYNDGRWQSATDIVIAGDKSIIKGDVMIDDRAVNLLGHNGILFDQPWNQKDGNLRACGWGEIPSILEDM